MKKNNIPINRMVISLVAFALMLSQGCASMNYDETKQYSELEAAGVECEDVVSPVTAGVLNVLPGFGDIYLASGDYGNGGPSWGAFALDFLLWTPSVVWAIPQAVTTANTINKKACISAHSGYTFNNTSKSLILKNSHPGNQWSNGVEFGTFNKGKPSERIKSTGQIPIITEGSPEYKERYK
jgi:hypothetical protein